MRVNEDKFWQLVSIGSPAFFPAFIGIAFLTGSVVFGALISFSLVSVLSLLLAPPLSYDRGLAESKMLALHESQLDEELNKVNKNIDELEFSEVQ